MPSMVLGVDGGNTKSIALLAAADGRVVGAGRAGCGDIYTSTPELAIAELDRAVGAALLDAGGQPEDIVSAAFSLAGADWQEDFEFLRAELARRLGHPAALVVVNDAIGALRAGTPDGVGVSIVCGTGSAIGARSNGNAWHTSFWAEDCGAIAMGRLALRAVVRSELGLDPPTDLATRALEAFRVASVDELLHLLSRRGTPTALVARLAPSVLDAAHGSDPAASRIVSSLGLTLGSYAGVAARRVGLIDGPFSLVFAGGVFRHPGSLLREAIVSALPGAHPVDAGFEPAVGALLLAFDRLGHAPSLEALRQTMPPTEYFSTDVSIY